jgi:hypothetical protein
MLTTIPGASRWFLGSAVTYHNDLQTMGGLRPDAARPRGVRAGGAGDGGGRPSSGGKHLGALGHRDRRTKAGRRRSRWGRCGPPRPGPWERGPPPPLPLGADLVRTASAYAALEQLRALREGHDRRSGNGRAGEAGAGRFLRPYRAELPSSPAPSSLWPASAAPASGVRARPPTSSIRPGHCSTAGWTSTRRPFPTSRTGPVSGRRAASGRAAPAPSAPPTAGS